MWFFLLNVIWAIHLFAILCCGARFIDLPAFDGELPAHPPNRRSQSHSKLEDSSITDEEQRISELDMPNTNDTISIDMLGYKGNLLETTQDEVNIETFNKLMSDESDSESDGSEDELSTPSHYPPVRRRMNEMHDEAQKKLSKTPESRRHWLVSDPPLPLTTTNSYELVDDKDSGLKTKILTLVQQTMHDTDSKVRAIQPIKENYRDRAPYRIGFILSMVKKSRDVLNELFNVAVKHREEWKALEQLKIFELIVHTNVDTTNLVRQLVELHINNLNATQKKVRLRVGQTTKHRVVIL